LKIIGYIRVSTSKQEIGPKAQRDQIERWCARQGFELVQTFEEKVSGGVEFDDLDKREALMAAIEALEVAERRGVGSLGSSVADRAGFARAGLRRFPRIS
jgi:DNA invertase Pin-like site-specific DNA recombinase